MQKNSTKWKSLPAEILREILSSTNQVALEDDYQVYQRNTRNFALVCKSWGMTAMSALYTNVSIQSLSQLKKFYIAVENNPYLGEKVKLLHLRIALPESRNKGENEGSLDELIDILMKLLYTYLPNLEDFKEDKVCSYLPTLNALMDSKLKHLKRISGPTKRVEKIEIPNYATCVLLMKERVEKIVLVDNLDYVMTGILSRWVYFNRLYDKLHQFDKLADLRFLKRSNEGIQDLEHIFTCCKSLKKLEFQFISSLDLDIDYSLQDRKTSMNAIPYFTPSHSLESLTGDLIVTSDYKMLFYIMHKFPKLQALSLTRSKDSTAKLNKHIFTQFLEYLSGINTFSAYGLQVDDDNMYRTIGNYLDSVSKPGDECVELLYSTKIYSQETCELNITRSKTRIGSTFSFQYSAHYQNSLYIDMLEKTGTHIGELRLKFDTKDSYRRISSELPEKFIEHVFAYCSNLRALYFDSCDLKRLTPSPSRNDLCRNLSIDELHLKGCSISYGFLEKLSKYINEVNHLYLNNIKYCSDENQLHEANHSSDSTALQICMPYTKIGSVHFENLDYHTIYHLKVFTENNGSSYYYRFDEILKYQMSKIMLMQTRMIVSMSIVKRSPSFVLRKEGLLKDEVCIYTYMNKNSQHYLAQ